MKVIRDSNETLVELLNSKIQTFIDYLNSLSEEELMRSENTNWHSLEHAEHIYNSLKLLPPLYSTPRFLLQWKFGKANRPSRSYEEVKKRYLDKLIGRDMRNNPFAAKKDKVLIKNEIIARLESCVSRLNKKVAKMSNIKLDQCILPHPLLGKITLREMILFSAYHVEQHLNSMKNNMQTN